MEINRYLRTCSQDAPQVGRELPSTSPLRIGFLDVAVPYPPKGGPSARSYAAIDEVFDPSRDPKSHNVVVAMGSPREASVSQAPGGQARALLFIHGQSTPLTDAAFRAAQIAHDIDADVPVFVFSWKTSGYVAARCQQIRASQLAAPEFADLLHLLRVELGVRDVHVIAHSQGNEVVLVGLDRSVKDPADMAALRSIEFASPPETREDFEAKVGRIAKRNGFAGFNTLYASKGDIALNAERFRVSLAPMQIGCEPVLGGDIAGRAGVRGLGVDSIDVSATPSDSLIGEATHDKYVTSKPVADDIKSIVTGSGLGKSPDKRNCQFKRRLDYSLPGREPYWVWQQAC
jgi:esterase/lipase superfamily enzyme